MDESASRLQPGLVLDGSYELLSVLGSGGMGTVWRAQHRRLPKQVAVKVLKGAEHADAEVLARFRREAEIASRLEHPHIVDALDFNTLGDGTPYMVLELLNGESLRARLQHGPLPLGDAVEIARQVGSALAAAHAGGVVHRDLKPENIFLCVADERVHVKVLDFGLSRIAGGDTALTKAGAVFGTPLYMAPEQAQGLPADARSDQHALAMVLFEMLHGRPAFVAEAPLQVLFRIVHEPAPALTELCPSLPPAVSAAVARALAKLPEDRFPDVRSFVQALTAPLGLESKQSAVAIGSRPVAAAPTLAESAPGAASAAAPAGRTISGHEATVDLGSAQTVTPLPKTLPPLEPGSARTPLPKTLPPLEPGSARAPLPKTLPPLEPGSEGTVTPLPKTVPTLEPDAPERRRIGAGLLAIGVLAVGLAGGALYWLRAPSRAATADGGRPAAGDRGVASRSAVAETSPRDLRPAGARDATDPRLARARDATDPRLARARDAAAEPSPRPGHRPVRVVHAPLPEPLAGRLRAAEALLASKQFASAGLEGERLERDLPEPHRWRGALVRVRAHCGLLQRQEALSAYRRLPPVAKGTARGFCRKFLPDFGRYY